MLPCRSWMAWYFLSFRMTRMVSRSEWPRMRSSRGVLWGV